MITQNMNSGNSWGGEIDARTITQEIDHLIANERPDQFDNDNWPIWKFQGFKIVLRPSIYGWLRLEYWAAGFGPCVGISVAESSPHRWIKTGSNIETWLNENGVESNIPFDGEPVDCADEYGLEAVA